MPTRTDHQTNQKEDGMSDLRDYGEYIRPATASEEAASIAASKIDGGIGAIDVDDHGYSTEVGT